MSAKLRKTTVTTRIIWILLGLFFIITVTSQIYIYLYNPLRIEVATMYSTTDSILFSGIYVRNERVIDYYGNGIIAYTHENGSKLAKNSVVAKSYNSQRDIAVQKQIEFYNNQIKILRDAEALENTDNSQLDSFNNQINNKHSELMLQLDQGNFDKITELKNSYLSLQCKKLIVRGTVSNYNAKIAQLEEVIRNLNSTMSSSPSEVRIGEAGYFVSVVDGYENEINYDTIESMDKQQIENIIKNPVISKEINTIGKIIDDYKWRLVGVLDTERTRSVFEGAAVEMKVGASAQTVKATVYKIKHLTDGTSIFIFECDRLSAEFVEKRVAQLRLILDNYKGIRIPSVAINFLNGERGVYIKSGDEIAFKKINVIKYDDDFVLVEDTTALIGYISLYDNIVVSGVDLYEGKIVL